MLKLRSLKAFVLVLITLFSLHSFSDTSGSDGGAPQFWEGVSYGDSERDVARLEHLANIPELQLLSEMLSRSGQKFRHIWGGSTDRMSIGGYKAWVNGQDLTHAAEPNFPGIASFGGRIQDMLAHFEIYYSSVFTNASPYTIYGQYGVRGAPYLKDGKIMTNQTIVPNDVWSMFGHPDSPLVTWRNGMYADILKYGKKDLKMVLLFGGASRDALATFLNSCSNARVEPTYSDSMMKRIQVPEFKAVGAGGNGEFAVPYTKQGGDVYNKLTGKTLSYYSGDGTKVAQKIIKNMPEKMIENMVFSQAGPHQNGLIHAAQIGGYNMDKIYIGNSKVPTRDLYGLILPDGTVIDEHIAILNMPHPTYLSNRKNDAFIGRVKLLLKGDAHYKNKIGRKNITPYRMLGAINDMLNSHPNKVLAKSVRSKAYEVGDKIVSDIFMDAIAPIEKIKEKTNWHVVPDVNPRKGIQVQQSDFDLNRTFKYGRQDIPASHGNYGTPSGRMGSESLASRLSHKQGRKNRKAQLIVMGTRDFPSYDKVALNKMLSTNPNQALSSADMWNSKIRNSVEVMEYDVGPPAPYDYIMKNYDHEKAGQTKPGMSFAKDGIDAFYVRTHPDPKRVGPMGHYRGNWSVEDKSRVKAIGFLDPDGVDSYITGSAHTGARGQANQGFMNDLGIGENHLLFPTLPYGMDGASSEDWNHSLEATSNAREELIAQLVEDYNPDFIYADGPHAAEELKKLLPESWKKKLVVVYKKGLGNNSGYKQAFGYVKRMLGGAYASKLYSGKSANIPRSHMYGEAKAWWGTSGDRALPTTGKGQQGAAFILSVPNWVAAQKPILSETTKHGIKAVLGDIKAMGLPHPKEKMPAYIKRRPIAGQVPAGCNKLFGKDNKPTS